jgi:hypothetical protein
VAFDLVGSSINQRVNRWTGTGWAYTDEVTRLPLAVADNGDVLVVDADNQRVNCWTGAGWENRGTSGLLASDGSIWYLGTATLDGAGNHAIYRLSNGQLTRIGVTSTAIGSRWLGMGGPASSLGLPSGGVNQGSGFQWQNFQKGAIYYSAATGVHAILGNPADPSTFWGRFVVPDRQRTLGLPTSDAQDPGDGGRIQHFQYGAVYPSPDGSWVHATDGNFERDEAHRALFSSAYLAFRDKFLTEFLYNGMVAKAIYGNRILFADQPLHMGFALQTFAGEAALFRRVGLDASPAERVINELLRGFEELEGAGQQEIYGTEAPGGIVRDLVNDQHRHGVPLGVTIISDSQLDPAHPEERKNACAAGLDQVEYLMLGCRSVVQWSGSDENIRLARAQTDRLMQFVMHCKWLIARPDGAAISGERGQDARAAAGFISKMADQIVAQPGHYFWATSWLSPNRDGWLNTTRRKTGRVWAGLLHSAVSSKKACREKPTTQLRSISRSRTSITQSLI